MGARTNGTAKPYRIEVGTVDGVEVKGAIERHAEVMEALGSLRNLVRPIDSLSQALDEGRQRDLQEAMRLKTEMDAISEAIQRTKQEIATLHYSGVQGREMARVTDELGAIVLGTETATHSILSAAESIDELAGNLTARLTGEQGAMARDISMHIVAIFEACNFQDITGQRISKVVSAMRFVEERVARMIAIWGGLESFKEVEVIQAQERTGDRALLNGPALKEEEATSQDDIDALFN